MKNAFTLLELIFAILIISIGILSLPTILLQDADSQEQSLFQEGISLASAEVLRTLTYPWDPNSSPGGAIMTQNEVLDTGGDGELNRLAGTDFRAGHFQAALRRRMTPNGAPRAASGIANGTNSISGQDGRVELFPPAGVGTAAGFKKQWQIATNVFYVNDNAAYNAGGIGYNYPIVGGGGTTNIKMVVATVTDVTPGSAGDVIVLRSYASNIGENDFFSRRY